MAITAYKIHIYKLPAVDDGDLKHADINRLFKFQAEHMCRSKMHMQLRNVASITAASAVQWSGLVL